jgi:NADPH-dependent curcumin reductase CurA
MTTYFDLRLCEPKAGDVCVVNGAVGSIVGQLAKLKVSIFFFYQH